MSISASVTNQQITASVGETQIDVSVSGGVGPTGTAGAAASVTVGTVTTGAPGSSAAVVNAGSSSAAVLNFTIPAGAAGATGATGPAGSNATATTDASALVSGTLPDARLSSAIARTSDVSSAVAALVNSSPAALDTLGELATALGSDANFSTTVTNALAAKAPLASPTFTGTVNGITKSMVGLGSVDNTADAAKPVSTAMQTALDGKAATSHTHSATAIDSGTLDFSRLPFTVAYPVRAVHVGGAIRMTSASGPTLFISPTYYWGGSLGDLLVLGTINYPATSVFIDTSASVTKSQTDNPTYTVASYSLEVALVDASNRCLGWATTSSAGIGSPTAGNGGSTLTINLFDFPTITNTTWVLSDTSNAYAALPSVVFNQPTAYKKVTSRYLDIEERDWDKITNKPVAFTPASHVHGSITNAGAIGSTSGQIVVTTTSGVLTTAATISSASVTGLPTAGTGSSNYCAGDDSRLSNARAPTAHKSSHATGGTDALTAADIGAAAASHTHSAADLTSGTVATARLGSGSASASNFLRGDGTWAAAGSTSASDLTSGTLPEARLNHVPLHPFLLMGG